MGQNSKWHAEQLNRYISDLSKTIHSISSIDNYHSGNHLTSDTTNDKNFVHNLNNSSNSSNSSSGSGSSATSVSSSDPLSPLSTAALLNNTLHSLTRRQLHNFSSSSFVERLSDAIQSALTSDPLGKQADSFNTVTTTTSNTTTITTAAVAAASDQANEHENDDGSIILNYWMLLLIVLYCIVVLGGIFGNASLIVTLFTQSSARLRNPLLVALCLADLMVTGVSAPLTVVALILDARKTITSTFICKLMHFMQVCQVFFIF